MSVLLGFDQVDRSANIHLGEQLQITIDCQCSGEHPVENFYLAASPNADCNDLDTTVSAGIKLVKPPNILADFTTPTDTRCGACIASLGSNIISNVTNCYCKF